jgi:ribosome-associated protein
MIAVTDWLSIDEAELDISHIRASGPGGQNVNKVSSAVQLRFDARRSASLPNDVSVRLQRLAGAKLTLDGVIVISAREHRSLERNRAAAIDRLVDLIRRAALRPPKRRATKPTYASTLKRLESKGKRGSIKTLRRSKPSDD